MARKPQASTAVSCIRLSREVWTVRIWVAHQQRYRKLSLGHSRAVAEIGRTHLCRIVEHANAGIPITHEDRDWVRRQPPALLDRLMNWGLVSASDVPGYGMSIDDVTAEWIAEAREAGETHAWVRWKLNLMNRIFSEIPARNPCELTTPMLSNALNTVARRADWNDSNFNKVLFLLRAWGRYADLHNTLPQGMRVFERIKRRKVDDQRVYAVFTDDQLITLLRTAMWSERGTPPGYERGLVYWLAVDTGMRAGEVRQMLVRHVIIEEGKPPHVYIPAAHNKARRDLVKPITSIELVARLYDYIHHELKLGPNQRVFNLGSGGALLSQMMRADLEEAGISYHDENGLRRSFHALRHTFCQRLHDAGFGLREAMEAMDHTDARLTYRTYGRDKRLNELYESMKKLPTINIGREDDLDPIHIGVERRKRTASMSAAAMKIKAIKETG